MALSALCALVMLPGIADLGQPVAEHTYYIEIEKALPNGTPDLTVSSNHWKQGSDQFYVYVDTRTMKRDADGKIHLPEMVLDYKEGGVPYKQQGRAPAGLGPEFHFVISPSPVGEIKVTYGAYDVSPTQEMLEYIVKTTIVETEVRLVSKHRVTRTQTTDVYGSRQVGLALHETYDPVTERRFKR
jgi:hypothetical protein